MLSSKRSYRRWLQNTWGIIKGFLSFFPRCNVSQVFKIESLEYIFYDDLTISRKPLVLQSCIKWPYIVCFITIKNVCELSIKKIQNACFFLTVYGNGDNDSWEERRKTGNELNWQPLIMITIGHHAGRIRWPQHACARHYYMLIFFSNDQHCPLSMRRIIAFHRLKVIQNQRRKTTASEAMLIVQNAKKNDFDSIIRNL